MTINDSRNQFMSHNLIDLLNPLIANPTKWSNTLKQFVGKLPTNCLSVFDHFVKLAFKGLRCSSMLVTSDIGCVSCFRMGCGNIWQHIVLFNPLADFVIYVIFLISFRSNHWHTFWFRFLKAFATSIKVTTSYFSSWNILFIACIAASPPEFQSHISEHQKRQV